MASGEQRHPSPKKQDAGTPPATGHRLHKWWRCRPACFGLPRGGLRAKKVALHSAWVSAVGLFLLRLATADTDGAASTEARVFAVAGTALASLPWLLLFLAAASVTALLEAGVCDLTWVFGGSGGGGPPKMKQKQEEPDGGGGDDDHGDEDVNGDPGKGAGAGAGGKGRQEADEIATCGINGFNGVAIDGVCLSMTSEESASSSVSPLPEEEAPAAEGSTSSSVSPLPEEEAPAAEASTSSSVSPLPEEEASTSSSMSLAEEQQLPAAPAAEEAPPSPTAALPASEEPSA